MEVLNLRAEGGTKSVRRFHAGDARRARDTKHFDAKKRDGVRCLAKAGSQVWGCFTVYLLEPQSRHASRGESERGRVCE